MSFVNTLSSIFTNLPNVVVQYFFTIKVVDIFDIGILTLVIYKVMWQFRKSKSSGVIKGIIFLLLAMFVSAMVGLKAINFILNRVAELGFIALIILFQPEIRRFLEQMGNTGWIFKLIGVKNHQATDLEQAIDSTVEAYRHFSKDKVGALVVFERQNSLNEYMRQGHLFDAETNSMLLESLFFHNSPMHDGAVIIRDGRIAGAGCMLPMTQNETLAHDLGMRHRAGIGLSEHSDAVVAIVSEETGAISVATNGMLKRHLAPDTFRRILENELLPQEPEQSGSKVLRGSRRLKKKLRKDSEDDAT